MKTYVIVEIPVALCILHMTNTKTKMNPYTMTIFIQFSSTSTEHTLDNLLEASQLWSVHGLDPFSVSIDATEKIYYILYLFLHTLTKY